jgi:aminoglycoside phosphotransferase (APT) family kinase protein
MTTTDVPRGINYDNVSRWFADNIDGGGDAPLHFEIIGDGRSNITYRVTNGVRTWVMRRPPLGHVLPTAHDMAREYRVQKALGTTGFPVPGMVALCEDTSVNDYPFYVMDFRDGVIIIDALPAGYADEPSQRRAIGMALIDTMVRLHAADYQAIGLADHGRPEGYLQRQVVRWSKQWEASKTRDLPEIDELIRRLNNAIPESPPPTIVHGDYRLGNMILSSDDPGKVEAVLDWEMSTLGDPLSDLGYTLVYWGNASDSEERTRARPTSALTAAKGFPTREELVAEYARQTGRDVSHIDFYQVFANYKLAVITEGIYKRFTMGQTTFEQGAGTYQSAALNLVQLALSQADASEDPKLRGH